MKIKVEHLGHVRNMIGSKREEEVEIEESSSIADLLMTLSKKYGKPFQKSVYETTAADVKSNFIVTINGYLLNQLGAVNLLFDFGHFDKLLNFRLMPFADVILGVKNGFYAL